MMKNNQTIALDHLNLTVNSFSESVDWYQRIFDFEKVEEGIDADGPWGVLKNGEFMLCIYESPKRITLRDDPLADRYHQIFHFGLRVADKKKWKNTVKEFSLRTYYGSPIRYPHSNSWYIKDPTGHMIEVSYWDNGKAQF